MDRTRIVVTGLGVVSCFGQDVDAFYAKLLAGESGVRPITQFPCEEFSTRFAATVQGFDSSAYIEKKQARRIDPYIAYGLVAGKKAIEQATREGLDPERCGVLIGSGMGGMTVFSDGVTALMTKGPSRITPFLIPYILTNMAGGLLAMDLGFMGPNYSVSSACATGNHSIIQAANHIRSGDADLMICGGVEAPVIPLGLGGFCAIKALSQRNDAPEKASRPWDKGRDGFVMGEGAGCLVLERLEHAQRRGATILAEYLGGGISCDAHHMTDPRADGAGVALCVRAALRNSGITSDDVNYINAHATSTPAGDMAEVQALKHVFAHPERIRIGGSKSMIGHSLGAAAGQEAVILVKAICTGKIHPTINLEDPEDTGFQIPTTAEEFDIKVALSNSFGFGGHNATIALAPYRP